jgi:hypothetical protein
VRELEETYALKRQLAELNAKLAEQKAEHLQKQLEIEWKLREEIERGIEARKRNRIPKAESIRTA